MFDRIKSAIARKLGVTRVTNEEKLKARAKSAGLVSYRFGEGHTSSASEYNGIDANVFMEAFRFSDTDPAAKN